MYCRQCQYDLTGLTSNRCPECGAWFSAANPLTWQPVPYTNRRFAILFCLALGCAPFVGALCRGLMQFLTPLNFWDF